MYSCTWPFAQPRRVPDAPAPTFPAVRSNAGDRLLRRRRTLIGVACLAAAPLALRAQADTVPHLGLGASSALSVHAGVGQFKHGSLGPEIGAALDLGWLGTPRVRLGVGLDYLASQLERPDSVGQRDRASAYVFTAFADVTVLTSLMRRVAPYAGGGFGVDAVGTTVQNEQIGALYNTNVFDLHAQLGAFVRLTPKSRASLEVRLTGARVVRRYAVRVGYTWFFNGLAPH